MEMGVSVLDAQSNYKVIGTKSTNPTAMKLSQFKTDFKSSTVLKQEKKKQKTSHLKFTHLKNNQAKIFNQNQKVRVDQAVLMKK
jgi:hypothetical protein